MDGYLGQQRFEVIIGTFFLIIGFLFSLVISFVPDSRLATKKSFLIQFAGTCIILGLALISNTLFVYSLSVIIIATLVTELGFLEKLIALVWGRDKYWDYLISQTPKQLKEQEKNTPNPVVKTLATDIKSARDREETLSELLYKSYKQKQSAVLVAHFEKSYRLIVEFQLKILQILRDKEEIAAADLNKIYQQSSLYPKYPLSIFIEFLVLNGFIEYSVKNDWYSISQLGILFLEYLEANNIPLTKPHM